VLGKRLAVARAAHARLVADDGRRGSQRNKNLIGDLERLEDNRVVVKVSTTALFRFACVAASSRQPIYSSTWRMRRLSCRVGSSFAGFCETESW